MRVIAGKARSLRLKTIEGMDTRPTTDRIKETLFNMLQPYLADCRFLDLFAGSGAVGLEALSRGMERVVFVDRSMEAVDVIRRNIAALGVQQVSSVWKMDWQAALRRCQREALRLDLVYLDPPYKKQQILHILQYLDTHDLVNELGDIVCESLKEDEFPDQVGALHKVKDVTYGITRITYYRKECME